MANHTKRLIKITATLVLFFFVPWGHVLASNTDTVLPPLTPEYKAATKTAAADAVDPTDGRQNSFKHFFQQGYDYYSKQKFQPAAEHLLQFLSARTPDDQDYEWAEFFYGMSLYKLGFTHAAVDTLTHLVTRKPNPQIVTYVLELLERISRTLPHDKDMLINRALCDQSYGFVDGPVTNFIHYYQGEYDWEHGFFEWGDEHFANIPEDTFYHNKYLFKRALREIYSNRIDEAISLLKTVILKLENGDPLKDDARKTLARLFYEKGNFAEADLIYQQIEMNIVEQAQNLLERAWVHYRLGNPERAMGLLYSFEAPSYVNAFTPEFYILKSFIYKDVCHYKTAMQVLEKFKVRYGDSLEHIYQRKPLHGNKAMLLVLLNKPEVKRTWRFINLLENEHSLAQDNPNPALKSYLDQLYTLKRQEIERKFTSVVNDKYEKMANAMLQFEEEAHLMEYEIGIDMYQRVQSYHYEEEPSEPNTAGSLEGKAVYTFQGEFWNDELDDYEVILPNKCQNAEEWDIFFK
jgi:tetratricopeptide (TPR) repeat protein